ncbi:MAG: NAD(P)/FAD-dependent oxidoreductase [bacterium]|nr:NAD(P)/FAD-dependent oxidoreductase [bacterium]
MKIGIIGGGAAGLTAAIQAAEGCNEVTVLEHMDRVGKKILSTGNGKCNLTNTDQRPEHYHGTHPDFAEQVFRQCSYAEVLHFFTKLGIYTKNKNGGLYPYSEQASAVLDVLRMKMEALHIQICCNTEVEQIAHKDQFHVFTVDRNSSEKKEYLFDRLILSTGGKAAKMTGSDGSGYRLAASMGHKIIEPLPALVQLRSPDAFFKGIAGIRCDADIQLYIDQVYLNHERGELQLTDYGISGIPVFQLSGAAARALYEHHHVHVLIDFMPDMPSVNDLKVYLQSRIKDTPYKTIGELMIGMFHKNLCSLFIRQCDLKSTKKAECLSDEALFRLSKCMKEFFVRINSTNSFDQAQTCSGGIDTAEIKDTLESKLIPGLYFAGEIMDINGDCGGYNLQWAWSTGLLAAQML